MVAIQLGQIPTWHSIFDLAGNMTIPRSAPCMVYLPTFTINLSRMQPNVGKYSIDGAYGI